MDKVLFDVREKSAGSTLPSSSSPPPSRPYSPHHTHQPTPSHRSAPHRTADPHTTGALALPNWCTWNHWELFKVRTHGQPVKVEQQEFRRLVCESSRRVAVWWSHLLRFPQRRPVHVHMTAEHRKPTRTTWQRSSCPNNAEAFLVAPTLWEGLGCVWFLLAASNCVEAQFHRNYSWRMRFVVPATDTDKHGERGGIGSFVRVSTNGRVRNLPQKT